jgi:hypothetical protein
MDRLNRKELEEMWKICFEQEDAETCFAIDKEYEIRYGINALYTWIGHRL